MSGEQLAFRCGVCHKKQRVEARFTGHKAMCPSCEATFVVPTAQEVAEALPTRLEVYPIDAEHSGRTAAEATPPSDAPGEDESGESLETFDVDPETNDPEPATDPWQTEAVSERDPSEVVISSFSEASNETPFDAPDTTALSKEFKSVRILAPDRTVDQADASSAEFEEIISADDHPVYLAPGSDQELNEQSDQEISISAGSSAVLATPSPEEFREKFEEIDDEQDHDFDASATGQARVLDLSSTLESLAEEQGLALDESDGGLDAYDSDYDDLDEDDEVFLEDDDSEASPDQLYGADEDLSMTPEQFADQVQTARRAGNVEQSGEMLEAALERYEASGALLLERGHLRAQQGDLEGAVDDFLEARDQGFDDSGALRVIDRYELDSLLDQAQQFILENPERSANLLRGIVAERPDYARAHYYMSLALRVTGQDELAAEALERASQLGYTADPEFEQQLAAQPDPVEEPVEDPAIALAEMEALLAENPAEVQQQAEAFLTRQPDSGAGYELLGEARRRQADHQEAQDAFLWARELGQSTSRVDRGIYATMVALRQEESAAAELTRQLREHPADSYWLRVQLGQHLQEEWWAEAVEDLVRLSVLAEDDPELGGSLELALSWLDPLEALSGLRQAHERDPGNRQVAEWLADLTARTGDFETAIVLYTQLLAQTSGRRGLLLKRASCWRLKLNADPVKALEDLGRAFEG